MRKPAGEQPVSEFARKLFTGFDGEEVVENKDFNFSHIPTKLVLVP